MPETTRGYPYPTIDDAPAGPFAIESLAEAINADVTSVVADVNELKTLKRSEWSFSSAGAPSGGVWGFNALANIPAGTTDTGFVVHEASDTLTITETGTYAAAVLGAFTVPPSGRCYVQIDCALWPYPIRRNIYPGEDIGGAEAPVFTVPADTQLVFTFYSITPGGVGYTYAGRVNIVKWAEA
jgi:hypothetical protein